jgi:hypothetical protein
MHTFQGVLHLPAFSGRNKPKIRVVAVMRKKRQQVSYLEEKSRNARCPGQKKWGLVIARFAIRSPVPRSALFLK